MTTREQRNAYNNKWYAKNKPRLLEYKRKWAEDNKEHRKAYVLKWRKKQPAWIDLLKYAADRAEVRGIAFDLTREWAEARWTGHCEMTGIPFQSQLGKGKHGPLSPSIDKIDQSKGYTQSNCRFILMAVNSFRGSGSDAQMYVIAEALLEARWLVEK